MLDIQVYSKNKSYYDNLYFNKIIKWFQRLLPYIMLKSNILTRKTRKSMEADISTFQIIILVECLFTILEENQKWSYRSSNC